MDFNVGFLNKKERLEIYDVVSIGAAAVSSVYLPLSFPRAAKRPLARRSKILLRSLSILSLTIKSFEGWIPT